MSVGNVAVDKGLVVRERERDEVNEIMSCQVPTDKVSCSNIKRLMSAGSLRALIRQDRAYRR